MGRVDLAVRCMTAGNFSVDVLPSGVHLNTTAFSPLGPQRELYEPVLYAPNSTFASHRRIIRLAVSASSVPPTTLPAALPTTMAPLSPGDVSTRWSVVYNLTG